MLQALLKRLKSKTYRAVFLLSVLTILEAHFNVFLPNIPSQYHPYVPLIWAMVMMFMRELTKEPVSAK